MIAADQLRNIGFRGIYCCLRNLCVHPFSGEAKRRNDLPGDSMPNVSALTPTLAEIKSRLDKATPGEWQRSNYDTQIWVNGSFICKCNTAFGGNDADLIAHAPSDLAFLIAEIESREAVTVMLNTELQELALINNELGAELKRREATIATLREALIRPKDKTPASRQLVNLSEALRSNAEIEVAELKATIARMAAALMEAQPFLAVESELATNCKCERCEMLRATIAAITAALDGANEGEGK